MEAVWEPCTWHARLLAGEESWTNSINSWTNLEYPEVALELCINAGLCNCCWLPLTLTIQFVQLFPEIPNTQQTLITLDMQTRHETNAGCASRSDLCQGGLARLRVQFVSFSRCFLQSCPRFSFSNLETSPLAGATRLTRCDFKRGGFTIVTRNVGLFSWFDNV